MRKHDSIHHIDKTAGFRMGALRAGVSAAALACLSVAAPAWAQDTQGSGTPAPTTSEPTQEDTIVVQGYRQSLQSAQNLKKNSDVIVDSVTAEDIGALPDRSVTETLQRIPGVSINRFAAGVDPDHFSVEGSGVVVRGLTYVRSEFNGREAFTANNGRSLSFADVPSEMMGGVDVFKSPSADRIEGGIAGVVNLRTRKPFDNKKGLVIAGSLEVNYGDMEKKKTPTGSIMISNRFETGIGEFGVLGNFSYSQLKSQSDRFQVSSFRIRNLYSDGDVVDNGGTTISKQVYFPRGAVMGRQEFNRERYGYAAALQYRSNDGSVEAVAQFLRSDARQAWSEHTIEIATDNVSANGDSRRVPGTTLDFDSDGMFVSGAITGPTGWRGDQNTGAARVPMLGLQSNNIRRDHQEKLVTDDYGFNLKWNATDRLGVILDYQHVKSTTNVLDNTLWNSTYQNASIRLNGSDFPTVAFTPPQVCNGPAANSQNPPGTGFDCNSAQAAGGSANPTYFGAGHTSFVDPYNSFPRAAMDHIEQSDGNSDAFRLDLDYALPENGFLKSIQGGIRYADRDQVSRYSRYNWGVLSEQWGNNGPVWLSMPVNGNNANHTDGTANVANSPYYFSNFFRGQVTNPLGGDGRLYYSGNTASDYASMIDYANMISREWQATGTCADGRVVNGGWNALANRCGVIQGTPFLPDEINPIRERNYAAYLMAKIDTHLGGLHLTGNVGVRYTKTKRDTDGYVSFTNTTAFPTDATCAAPVVPPATPSPFCSYSIPDRNAARAFVNGSLTPSHVALDYTYWLPSVNFKLEAGGGLQFRAAYFKGVSPPQTGLIRNYLQANLSVVQNVDANGNLVPGSFRFQGVTTAGNPYLKPVEADNFDLTAEWYFSRVGSLTVSAFYKVLSGVVTNDTRRVDLTNNGQTYPVVITTPINATEKGKIKGVEVSYQQTFDFLPGPLKGLGLQANYTYVDSSGVPQSTLSETDPDVAAGRVTTVNTSLLPLQGLSKHQVNITPFFDYGPLSLRASYSWRSDFLLTVRDVIVPNDPIINKATGQLDASIFFAITPQIKIGVQGSNLTNEVTRTNAVISKIGGGIVEVPRGWYMNDRRFAAIARFNF